MRRWDWGLRTLAAFPGGYAFASGAAMVLSLLPVDRAQAVLGASMAGFALWTVAAIWSFACGSGIRACLGIFGGAAVLVAIASLAMGAGL